MTVLERKYFDKVGYIVPSDRIQKAAERALTDELAEGWLDVIQIDLYNIQEEYERLVQDGYGCLIARGGTFHELHALDTTIPVVEERIRTADILEMTADYFRENDRPLYVVIHEDVAVGFENVQSLIPDRIRVLRYESIEDLKNVLAAIPDTNVDVFTSGIGWKVLERNDLHLIEIRNREHTMRTSAQSAHSLLQQMRDNITQVNVLNSVYNNIDEGILIFRPDNVVTEINQQAEKMLHLESREAIGRDVYSLVPNMPPKKKDGTCSVETPTTFMTEITGRKLNFSIYPFDFFRGRIRNMVIIQDVTRIQAAETKIRMQLSKKGLVAEHTFDNILSQEPIMEHVVNRAKKIATFDGSVLIYGESGTGKELFAQSIHNASERRNGPFVAVNCGALTDSLLESELFGYVGGSFTGARKEGKPGLFELAHRGTIFLDEINSTPMNLQTKILRVLEERQVMRVGSDYVIPLDIRVISASNTNLSQDVEAGRFRRDLFFRLNTFQIHIPPLRERPRDIVMLFRHYLEQYCDQETEISPEFREQLESHYWMGNVRELRSVALRYHAFDGDNSMGDILMVTPPSASPVKEEPAAAAQFPTLHMASTSKMAGPSDGDAQLAGAGTYPAIDGRPDSAAGANSAVDGNVCSNDASGHRAFRANDDAVKLSDLSRVVEELVIESLEGRGLSRAQIARELGISRQTLYNKLKKSEDV